MHIPPSKLNFIHFVGIGGIGMSGIAEVLHNLGYLVQGSDASDNANVKRLRNLGINIATQHSANNLRNAELVVVSSAISKENIEIRTAYDLGIPVIKRAEMLAEILRLKLSIAVSGTHGKTTTTSIIGAILDHAELAPTIINGGIINSYGSNIKLGSGDWAVVESDESDGSFLQIPATIGVVTNIDPEHMDHYGDMQRLENAFVEFIQKIPFYGLGVLCCDNERVARLSNANRRIVTYGIENNQAMLQAINIRLDSDGTRFDLLLNGTLPLSKWHQNILQLPQKDLFIPMYGVHNLSNTLAAIAVAYELGISPIVIREALQKFNGVKRRFSIVGKVNNVTVVDDYAHHPTEIAVVLKAAKQNHQNAIIPIVQPHRYTRLRDLFDDFQKILRGFENIIIMPVYSANESVILGYEAADLANAIKPYNGNVYTPNGENELYALISTISKPSDMLLCMGAGNITNMAHYLPEILKNIESSNEIFHKQNLGFC